MSGTRVQLFNKWLFTVLGFVVLFNYQNCAKQNGVDPSIEAAMPVDVIDHLKVGQVKLALNKVVLSAKEDTFKLDGFCQSEGSIMAWNLWDPNNELLEKGHVECVNNAFSVVFEGAQEIKCGVSYTFAVNLGAKSADKMNLEKNCQ